MQINILFFGATADLAGMRNGEIGTTDGTTAGVLLEKLRADHPAFARQRLLIAVNEEYVPVDTILKDGDSFAVFTAVSGG